MMTDEHRQCRDVARVTVAALCAAACIALGGCCRPCRGARAAGSPLYYSGRVEQTLRVRLPTAYKAAAAVLEDMALPLLEKRGDKVGGRLTSKLPDGRPVHVELEALGKRYTRVTVQVGYEGERRLASAILARIRRRAR